MLTASTSFAQIERQVGGKLWITIPKNLAVFHILVLLTPARFEQEKLFGHPLAREAREYFRDFKNHPAVQATEKIFSNMWYFPLNYAALFHTDFPEAKLKPEIALPPEFTNDETMREMISDYVQVVRDFYMASRFEEFWDSHKKNVEAIAKEVSNNLSAVDIPSLMEKFYGSEAQRYYLVPCPFMQNSATHVEVKNREVGWRYYYLAGGDMFSDSFYNVYFAFHEFSHSFVEPISSKYSDRISELEYLYKPLRERFQQMGYRNWDRAFNEHLVTAGQLHLTRQVFGEEKKDKMMEGEKRNGFKLIERFFGYLEDYDNNRGTYGHLEAFYPRIMEALSRIKVEEYRKPGVMGFYPEFKESRLFVKDVIPNSAFEKADIQKGDILFSIGKMKMSSEDRFHEAKEKLWDQAKEGTSVEVVVVRNGDKTAKNVIVPFVTDYRYVEK